MSPTTAASKPVLLSVIELGGYPDFTPVYQRAGCRVQTVIVAEFNFQSDFRDRTSSLESLLAVVQRLPGTRVIVFYEPQHAHQLDRLRARFPIFAALPYPIDAKRLEDTLRGAISSEENVSP